MEQVSYKFVSNDKVQFCIPLEGRLKLIDAEAIVSPDGDRCVVYDNYVVSLQQMWQNATDIDFYLEKKFSKLMTVLLMDFLRLTH